MSGRSPGGGHSNPLQDPCLENPRDRGAWRAAVHGAAKRWTLEQLSGSSKKLPDPHLDFMTSKSRSQEIRLVLAVFAVSVVSADPSDLSLWLKSIY